MNKTALVCGISGQDGGLLAKLLLNKGYKVVGQTRSESACLDNLGKLGIRHEVEIQSCSLLNREEVDKLFEAVLPDEVYNLSGQSSVGLSFSNPVGTFESHAMAALNLLEAIHCFSREIKMFNAGSGECYGDVNGAIDVDMPLRPVSPYGVAKSSSFLSVENYRKSYGLYVCTGILFNHESPFRSENFVTQKVVKAACEIAQGSVDKLTLGNLDVIRDWGWAEEYVEAMWLMLQQEKPQDFVISTGEKNSLQDFVKVTFETLGLDWLKYVEVSDTFKRSSDIHSSYGNPSKAKFMLGWSAQTKMNDVIGKMIQKYIY